MREFLQFTVPQFLIVSAFIALFLAGSIRWFIIIWMVTSGYVLISFIGVEIWDRIKKEKK